MEDFVVLSVLDLQLDIGRTLEKNKIMYYVMNGDECVDSLILGASNA